MDFSFTNEQLALVELADEIAADAQTAEPRTGQVRPGEPAGAWQRLAESGLLGLLVPEAAGGAGASLVEACLVIESLARARVPVPYLGGAVLPAAALATGSGSGDAVLAELAGGRRLCLALDTELTWPPRGDTGLAWDWYPDATVLVPGTGGLTELPAGRASEVGSEDLLSRVARVAFDTPPPPPDPTVIDRVVAVGRVAVAARLLGAADGALQMAVEHARCREQFGRPIGSFQAVAHLCADLLAAVETCRSVAYGAAWEVEHLCPDAARRSAAVALAWCGEKARTVCEGAIQVLGGIGVTWESDAHLYLRAALTALRSFGGPAGAVELVARSVLVGA
jgi:alkylation response protein AidB-like acyl-CoA dehydrogenase